MVVHSSHQVEAISTAVWQLHHTSSSDFIVQKNVIAEIHHLGFWGMGLQISRGKTEAHVIARDKYDPSTKSRACGRADV
jgi:hypothetical protein